MKPRSLKAFVFYLIVTFVLLEFLNTLRDLIIKNIAYLNQDVNPLYTFVLAKNSGAAFSVFENSAVFFGYFAVIAFILVAIYVYKRVAFENKILLIICTLFSSGILGNMLERLNNGYVLDYIRLKFIDFPVFNLFDIMITISIILYIFLIFFGEEFFERYKKKK